jgi:hypothetical protein
MLMGRKESGGRRLRLIGWVWSIIGYTKSRTHNPSERDRRCGDHGRPGKLPHHTYVPDEAPSDTKKKETASQAHNVALPLPPLLFCGDAPVVAPDLGCDIFKVFLLPLPGCSRSPTSVNSAP